MLDPARTRPPRSQGGLLTPVIFPAIVGVLLHITDLFVLQFALDGSETSVVIRVVQQHLLANSLYVSLVIWAFLAWRRGLDPATGAGFSVAALGLLLRALVVFERVLGYWTWSRSTPPPTSRSLLALADFTGMAAYAFGLAVVLFSVIHEWNGSRRT